MKSTGILMLALTAYFLHTATTYAQVAQSGAKKYGDADRGKMVMETWCTGCHVVGPVVNDRIPSLAALAANPKTEGAIRAFLMQPHKPMPPLELSTQQIEDILAYLQKLRGTPR